MKKANKKKSLAKVKKDTWDIFSIFTRMRDGLRTTGTTEWALCITCDKRYHFKLLQAGHLVAGRGSANLFYEKGTHAQCYNCNINLKGNTLVYRRKVNELYGEGTDLEIEANDKKIKKFTIPELLEMQEYYKAKIEEMKQLNHTPELLAKREELKNYV